jgi:hypothetical protein
MSEPIEETIWRTIKILRVFSKQSLWQHVNMTHVCTIQRITRYLNLLVKNCALHCHGNTYQISHKAPAKAPIFRKVIR